MMTPQTFQNRLDQWGSALDDWPRAEQKAAQALLHSSPEARRMLAAAERLTLALQRPAPTVASDALRLRLKTIPAHYPQSSRIPVAQAARSWASGWLWGGSVALASGGVMALGFMASFSGLITPDAQLIDWAALAYGSL